jgi:phosphate/sulfate permease
MNCFIWIYFPIIGAAIVAIIFSQIAGLWIQAIVGSQDESIYKEVREPWEIKREKIKADKLEVKKAEKRERIREQKAKKAE